MTAVKRSKRSTTEATGMWAAFSLASDGGWGTTLRMLVLLLTLGTIVVCAVVALGLGPLASGVRILLALLQS